MNYNGIIKFDTGNSHGISTTLFVSGCNNKCKECHNPQTWDCDYGTAFTSDTMKDIIISLDNAHINNFVLSGGDPLFHKNLDCVSDIVDEVRKTFGYKKNIILYTGMTVEEILVETKKNRIALACLPPVIVEEILEETKMNKVMNKKRQSIISKIDYLIDGRYDLKKKTKGLDLRGSYNQQCYSIETIRDNCVLTNISFSYFREKFDLDLKNFMQGFNYTV